MNGIIASANRRGIVPSAQKPPTATSIFASTNDCAIAPACFGLQALSLTDECRRRLPGPRLERELHAVADVLALHLVGPALGDDRADLHARLGAGRDGDAHRGPRGGRHQRAAHAGLVSSAVVAHSVFPESR
jgi:hypothetical protein